MESERFGERRAEVEVWGSERLTAFDLQMLALKDMRPGNANDL